MTQNQESGVTIQEQKSTVQTVLAPFGGVYDQSYHYRYTVNWGKFDTAGVSLPPY